MSTNTTNLEISGPTVEDAIEEGLKKLGVTRDSVEIEILEEGNRGIFGLGSREATVRIVVKELQKDQGETPGHIPVMEPEPPSHLSDSSDQEVQLKHDNSELPTGTTAPPTFEEESEHDHILTLAQETVEELLQKMKLQANVSASYGPTKEYHHRPNILIDITGEDLSILIGRRAETLNALQLISRLIVGKELARSVNLQVDVQGYRERRTNQLRRLAQKIAEQALKTGRRQTLEPMPANERRIIHLEFRDHPKLFTESVGEGARRKVTIVPK
jgi:spoIIIJ-associated protein